MSLRDRIHNPDRRLVPQPPEVERRAEEPRRLPRWIKWTRENEERGKALDSGRPA